MPAVAGTAPSSWHGGAVTGGHGSGGAPVSQPAAEHTVELREGTDLSGVARAFYLQHSGRPSDRPRSSGWSERSVGVCVGTAEDCVKTLEQCLRAQVRTYLPTHTFYY